MSKVILNNPPVLPNKVENSISNWEEIAFQVEKIWLHVKYYLYCFSSCLDYFARKELFEGGTLIAPAYNFGRKEDIPRALKPIENPDFAQLARDRGFAAKKISLAPYDGGVCYGASLDFAVRYFDEGVEEAALNAAGGASAEAVSAQAHYQACSTVSFFPLMVVALKDYISNSQIYENLEVNAVVEALFKKHGRLEDALLRKLFGCLLKYTIVYVAEGKKGSYLSFMVERVAANQDKLAGKAFATVREVECELQGTSSDHAIDMERQRLTCAMMGLQIVEDLFIDASATTILNSNPLSWKKGLYKIGTPTYSRGKTGILLMSAVMLIAGAYLSTHDFFGMDLQHIGYAYIGLSGIALYGNWRYLREREGLHAVTFIVEEGRCILHDPSQGTGTHNDGARLLRNLFDLYGTEDKEEITIQRLGRKPLAPPQVPVA